MKTKEKENTKQINEFGRGWVVRAIFKPMTITVAISLIVLAIAGLIANGVCDNKIDTKSLDKVFEVTNNIIAPIVFVVGIVLLIIIFFLINHTSKKLNPEGEKVKNPNLKKQISKVIIEIVSTFVTIFIIFGVALLCAYNQEHYQEIEKMSCIITGVFIIIALAILMIFWFAIKYIAIGNKNLEKESKGNKENKDNK